MQTKVQPWGVTFDLVWKNELVINVPVAVIQSILWVWECLSNVREREREGGGGSRERGG